MSVDTDITGTPGRYWHRLEDGRLQCDLCPRYCKLRDQQRGMCFVRARADEELVLTSYGRSSGFCIDPIEKKPLNHFFARHARAVVRDGWLQFSLQVLPELGYLQIARVRPPAGQGVA